MKTLNNIKLSQILRAFPCRIFSATQGNSILFSACSFSRILNADSLGVAIDKPFREMQVILEAQDSARETSDDLGPVCSLYLRPRFEP